jgi:RNA polymerase primary sigma factor
VLGILFDPRQLFAAPLPEDPATSSSGPGRSLAMRAPSSGGLPPASNAFDERRTHIPATLKMAIALGLEAAVRLHLTKGTNPNARDEKGKTPLILAASRGHRAICSLLLSAGANPDLKDDAGHDALETAVRSQRPEVADLLKELLSRRNAPADVPPTNIDEDSEEFDLSAWRPEADPEPPPADPTVLLGLHELDAILSTHIPIDLDEDWSDVEIDLPELTARRPRKVIEEEACWLAAVRRIMRVGLREGIVMQRQLDAISAGDGPEEEGHTAADRLPLLQIALGDLGIRIVEGPDFPDPAAVGEDDSDDAPDLDEGMAFLRSLMAPTSDPLYPYFRNLSRSRPLSREEEDGVARDIEQGRLQALVAIASSSPAMAELFRIVDAVENGNIQWRDVLNDDPAYMEDGVAPHESFDDDDESSAETNKDTTSSISPGLPSLLALRLASLRRHYLELTRIEAGAAADRLHEILALHLSALEFRESWFDRIRLALTTSEPDAGLRTAFAEGIARARSARLRLFDANQKFVVWIARQYHALPLCDLIQEGCIGLLRAIEKFDPKRGYRLGTYAKWWIRQAITHAIDEQSGLIRIPVHAAERLRKMRRAIDQEAQRSGRPPALHDLAASFDITERKAADLIVYLQSEFLSLDQLDSASGEISPSLVDETPDPEKAYAARSLAHSVQALLATLTERDRAVLRLRFGIGVDADHTLEEIGSLYGVTRERIRQIEANALRKLERRARHLRVFLQDA